MLEANAANLPRHSKRFASLALKGRYALGAGSDNSAVRKALDKKDFMVYCKNGRQPVPGIFPDE